MSVELGFLKKRFPVFRNAGRNVLLDETGGRLDLPAISTAVSASNENTACGCKGSAMGDGICQGRAKAEKSYKTSDVTRRTSVASQ